MTERADEVDVVVVGLGPGGEAVASKLASAGLEVVAVERHLVGGECPYYGCVPTKMMVRAAHTLAEARRVTGLAGEAAVTPSWEPVAARVRAEATDDWDDTVAVERLERAGATVLRGHGRLSGPGGVVVDRQRLRARRAVVLNTGTAPGAPPVDGLAATPYWTNRDVVRVTSLPSSLAVLGGGAIGCEIAQAFARFGVRVAVVEAAPRLLGGEEPEVSELVNRVFTAEGIRVVADATIERASYDEGMFRLELAGDPAEVVRADKLLVAAGRVPQIGDVGLETVGLDPSAKRLETDEAMRVLRDGAPVEGLYAVGDITGKGAFTHTSMYGAAAVVRDVLGQGEPDTDFEALPRVTFTDPEVGSVGLTEQQARDGGLAVRTALVEVPSTSRGWLHGAGNDGLVKLVVAEDRLVGATAAGPAGGEVLSMLTLAVHARLPVATLESMIYAYPTFHGGVRDALATLG